MSAEAVRDSRFEEEEAAYWRQREELLRDYSGRWVAIVDGAVVAVGERSGDVIREAYTKTGSRSGYVAHVGHEDAVYRIRQVRVVCRNPRELGVW